MYTPIDYSLKSEVAIMLCFIAMLYTLHSVTNEEQCKNFAEIYPVTGKCRQKSTTKEAISYNCNLTPLPCQQKRTETQRRTKVGHTY